ncbi:MAG: helix-hairpin-helix domain-containing protein [Patescibacteria group bacterium]|nr:helix-hairpin-helix domain-containing protein [Patescibacteria group bacterium]
MIKKLEDIPNVGPKIARCFREVGITRPSELKNNDPLKLYERLNKKTGKRHDPCLLDTFMAAVAFMNGAPSHPWWHYTPERRLLLMRKK